MRRSVLVLFGIAVLLAGCTSQTGGSFELLVSDQPSAIGEFDRLDVTFAEARIFGGNNSAPETLQLNSPTADLTQLTGDRVQSILNTTLEPGRYTKIELHVGDVNGVVAASDVEVKVPSEKLMITKPFDIVANETTEFVFDIQVVARGDGAYNLIPVISQSGTVGEEIPSVERGSQAPEGAGNP